MLNEKEKSELKKKNLELIHGRVPEKFYSIGVIE